MVVTNTALQGLDWATSNFNKAADRIAKQGPDAEGAVALMQARNEYEVKLKSLYVADQMTKSTLDILA